MKAGVAAGWLATAALLSGCRSERAYAQALPDSPTAQPAAQLTAQTSAQQAAIPDSPRPQTLPNAAAVTPGKGSSGSLDATATDPDAPGTALRSGTTAPPAAPDSADTTAPEIIPDTGVGGRVQPLRVRVNFVEVPFTVKDKKGSLVPALSWRDVQVFENGVRKHLSLFTTDPYPLSVAFIVDQSMPYETMNQVNTALGAVQGAFTPYDEMAIYTYNNGTKLRTDYTGAQSARIGAVLAQSKSTGREADFSGLQGPLDQNVQINDHSQDVIDPNTSTTHRIGGARAGNYRQKEQHPLNDAIFEAAQSLARRSDGRRRIIYVVSDGREAGSKVKGKELVKFMQTNKISLYATVVGDSSTPYVGFLDKYHIPLTMRENVLPQYASATGGEAISEFRLRGIETSFAKIAEEVRVQYTAGYYSNEPLTDGKYRTLEVQVSKPGLDVIAKKGYYPSAEAQRPSSTQRPQ